MTAGGPILVTGAGVAAPPEYSSHQDGQRLKQLRSVLFDARHPAVTFTPFDTGLDRTIRSLADGL